MSSSSTEEELNQELDKMRDLIRQYQQQASLSSQHNRDLKDGFMKTSFFFNMVKSTLLQATGSRRAQNGPANPLFATESTFTTYSTKSPASDVVSRYVG